MMTNLFSSFDPSSCISNLNWLSSTLFLLLLSSGLFIKSFKMKKKYTIILNLFKKETDVIIMSNKPFSLVVSLLFMFIVFNNFLGMFPYIFTSTSHMSFTMTLALMVWLSLMLYGWSLKTKEMFSHLVPNGTPFILMPFMVLIESISNLIRPLTLAIRLSANMIAGHLLLTLAGNQLSDFNMFGVMFPSQILLLSLELSVSIIQAYVFSILMTLYVSEVSEAH